MTISFKSAGQIIAGNLFEGHSDKPAFLFIQGWSGHQNLLTARALATAGYTTLTYDMRGHGDSEGDLASLSRANFINDSVLAYDYLKSQVSTTSIGVVGSSFGSYTAIHLSAQRQAMCLSLRVPAIYPDTGYNEPQLAQIRNKITKTLWEQPLSPDQNKSLAIIHQFRGPVQIIESGNDEIIPRQNVQNIINAVNNPAQLDYHLMKSAPHSLKTEALQHEYRDLLLNWIINLTTGTLDSDPARS